MKNEGRMQVLLLLIALLFSASLWGIGSENNLEQHVPQQAEVTEDLDNLVTRLAGWTFRTSCWIQENLYPSQYVPNCHSSQVPLPTTAPPTPQ